MRRDNNEDQDIVRVPILSPLNKTTFSELIGETFRSVNITVISIIQGVALGVLVINVAEIFLKTKPPEHWWVLAMYPVLSFVAIATITFEYSHYVGIFRRPASVSDVCIPYILGVSEMIPMFFFDNPSKWWLFEGVFLITTAAAWTNTKRYCIREIFGEYENARCRYILAMNQNSISATIVAAMSFSSYYYFANTTISPYWQLFPGLMLASWGSWILLKSQILLWKLHLDFGFTPHKQI